MASKYHTTKDGKKAKKDRIAAGSGEKMRKVGTKGAPTKQAFINSAKTAKKPKKKKTRTA